MSNQEKTEYSEETIQNKIDRAVEDSIYYDVSSLWSKTAVIGGAKRRWDAEDERVGEEDDDHFVYAPGGRLCGPRSLVLETLGRFKIDDDTLYTSVDSPGFKEELEEYKKPASSGTLLDDSAMKELKAKIKRSNEAPSLKSLIRDLGQGKVVHVSDIKEGKFAIINAPLATITSRYVCVPGLAIASKTEEAFVEALGQLEVSEEKRIDYVAAFQALAKFRKADSVPKPKAKKTAPAEKAPKTTAAAKKTAPAAAKKTAPAPAAKKGTKATAKK